MIGFRLTTSTSTKMTTLFRSLTRVLRIGKEKYLVGHDLNNNAYYELPSRSGSNGKCKPPLINVTQLSPSLLIIFLYSSGSDPRHTRRTIFWREVGLFGVRSVKFTCSMENVAEAYKEISSYYTG